MTAPHPYPTEAMCQAALDVLSALHGAVRRGARRGTSGARRLRSCGAVPTVLDAVIRTILSQNTTNKNSGRAMARLTERFAGDFAAMQRANVQDIIDSIACGGLSRIKGPRIKAILDDVLAKHGQLSLEHLRDMPDAAAKAALMEYHGVGPKTASCVLLFCLQRESFAVDTHVFRIAGSLGWLPPRASRERAHLHLDACIPGPLKYPLHVLLIRHGQRCRACMASGRARPGPCPLQDSAARAPISSTRSAAAAARAAPDAPAPRRSAGP